MSLSNGHFPMVKDGEIKNFPVVRNGVINISISKNVVELLFPYVKYGGIYISLR